MWDIYVHIRAGWVYVAFIVDAYSPPEPGFGTIYGRLLMDICVRSRRNRGLALPDDHRAENSKPLSIKARSH